MNPSYTKSKPKLNDYNPILHSPCYSNPRNASYQSASKSPSPQRNYLQKSTRQSSGPISQAARLQMSITPSKTQNRLYKTRPKDTFSNPITGQVRKFNLDRSMLEGLDMSINKVRFPRESQQNSQLTIQRNQQIERVSGALKKEVHGVSYVSPFLLKSKPNASLNDPALEISARKFYGN